MTDPKSGAAPERAAGSERSAGSDPALIRVRVRLFAMQRELAGTREEVLELSAGATIEQAWEGIVAKHPLLAPGRPSVRFARNAAYAPASASLEDGDEVAMIPPVSGGSEATTEPPILELREAPFTKSIIGDLADRLAVPADGAVVGFLGITRSSPGTPAPGQEAASTRHAGRSVSSLEYEAHPVMTLRILEAIASEIAEQFGIERLAIVHRIGEVPLGEPSVAVVACAAHRDAAFEAARYAIDQTKARAPIWKAEHFEDGKVWIGEPPSDPPKTGATHR